MNDALPEDARVSVNDLLVRACALALRAHPEFNVTWWPRTRPARRTERLHRDRARRRPDRAGRARRWRQAAAAIARETKDLVERAKGAALRQDEITAGTFTITNLGAFGVETLIGIIQPPQTAILGVGSVMDQPVAIGASVTVRKLMKVALSADHRVTDGAQGARFLQTLRDVLEKPALMFV